MCGDFIHYHRDKGNWKKIGNRRLEINAIQSGCPVVSVLYRIFLGYPHPGQMKGLVWDQVFQELAGLIEFPGPDLEPVLCRA